MERQTLHGFPTVDSALFTIRTYLYEIDSELTAEHRVFLADAIRSMSADSARYKGLDRDRAAVLHWLHD